MKSTHRPTVRLAVVAGLAVALCGCATDRVLFVTKTSLAILEADTKPASISIAYDRVEGYLGPTSESGEAPAVLGYFGSDGTVFNPRVKQVYATGNAARVLTGVDSKCTPKSVTDDGRVMFFGTSTSSGLKIGFTPEAPLPDSFVFGWRRKEFSLVPLLVAGADTECSATSKLAKGQKFYPATLASVNSTREVPAGSPTGTKLTDQQYFATGDAAVGLAGRDEVKGMVTALSKDVFADYRAAEAAQKTEAVQLTQCYAGLRPTDRPTVWDEAAKFELFQDDAGDDTPGRLKTAYGASVDAQGRVTDASRLARADRVYVTSLLAPGGSKPERAALLAIHKKTVCALSALNQP